MKTSLKMLLGSVLTVLSLHAFAGNSGGGGTGEEPEYKKIIEEIHNWINSDEYLGINLFNRMSNEEYKKRMLFISQPNLVDIEFTEDEVLVNNIKKDCSSESVNGKYHTLCNKKRFNNLSQELKFRLVHHELAVLMGVEVNEGEGEKSDYLISDQLSNFAHYEYVLKLGPKNKSKFLIKFSSKKITPIRGEDDVNYFKVINPKILLIKNIEKVEIKISENSNLNYICHLAGYNEAVRSKSQYMYNLMENRIIIKNENDYKFQNNEVPLEWVLCK